MTSLSQLAVREIVTQLASPSEAWRREARAHLDELTKPLGSLGRLEDIAAQMVSIRQERSTTPFRKAVYIFAADHGITAEGVSAYPSEVTHQMVLNFLSGVAAINVLAKLHGVEMNVVDVGVDADLANLSGCLDRKICRGTRNMLHEAAMSDGETAKAIEVGYSLALAAKQKGQDLVAVGEMGIGNTTSASAIAASLTGARTATVTGKGTGLDPVAQTHKRCIVEAVLCKHFGHAEEDRVSDPFQVLCCVGGLEIAAMTGMMLGAARHGIAIVVDGFISTAAAAIAFAMEPRVREYFFAGHRSAEPGHQVLLEHIGIEPILSLGMHLGEGTGAVLAMPIIESAMSLYNEMGTFSSAGVSGAVK